MAERSASKKRRGELGGEDFDRLLDWLGGDREQAGYKYEEIRTQLVRIFLSRGCTISEELADEVFDRVARRVSELAQGYEGDPALYFFGVAQNVYREYLKVNPDVAWTPPANPDKEIEAKHACLEQCVQSLSIQTRRLILGYYTGDGQKRIENRQRMARRMGIGLNGLRIRAHRIKETLRDCVRQCLDRTREN
ncbi:MAG: hypothetical protein ACREDR_04510 [Blastocatellia bacterium]